MRTNEAKKKHLWFFADKGENRPSRITFRKCRRRILERALDGPKPNISHWEKHFSEWRKCKHFRVFKHRLRYVATKVRNRQFWSLISNYRQQKVELVLDGSSPYIFHQVKHFRDDECKNSVSFSILTSKSSSHKYDIYSQLPDRGFR